MTKEQHLETFRRVEELMWEDPMSLLQRHRHLLEENLGELGGECSTATLECIGYCRSKRLKPLLTQCLPEIQLETGIKPLYQKVAQNVSFHHRQKVWTKW